MESGATSSRDLAPNDVYGYAKTGTIPAGKPLKVTR